MNLTRNITLKIQFLTGLAYLQKALRKTSGAFSCIISRTIGHLKRTVDVALASWIASSNEIIQTPLSGFELTAVIGN
jgi:hypothetical protein